MKKIAIIDDREELSSLIEAVISDALINLEKTDEWGVIKSLPLNNVQAYTDWIAEQNVGVLIVDEMLGERPSSSGAVVNYTGGDVVTSLRREVKDMPLYGVTSFPANVTEQQFGLFDDVILRETFTSQAERFVRRFIRQHEDFLEANAEELTELSELSEKIAKGDAQQADINRAKAIQQNIEIPVTSIALAGRGAWLEKYEATLGELEEAQQQAEEFLRKNSTEKDEK